MIILPFRVIAMEHGTEISWNYYDNMVRIKAIDDKGRGKLCTGTSISGRYILTAAHCLKNLSSGELITKRGRHNIPFALHYINPTYNKADSTGDIALIKLMAGTRTIKHKNINYFPDFTQNKVKPGQRVFALGFGGDTPEKLQYIEMKTSKSLWDTQINGKPLSRGRTTYGDSGGAWLNFAEEIIAPHSYTLDGINTESASNLFYAKDFLLNTINGWYYPTLVDVDKNQRTAITIQSLHISPEVDQAYTSGDVVITGGSCRTLKTIKPFEKCAYEVSSNGKPGKIHLGNKQKILINTNY